MEFIRPQRGGQFCRGKLFAHSRPPRKPAYDIRKSRHTTRDHVMSVCLSVEQCGLFVCGGDVCLCVRA